MLDVDASGQGPREAWVSWSAFASGVLAVFASASCCVLPMALSIAGLSLVGTGFLAQQRIWITALAALTLTAGWVLVVRGMRRGRADGRRRAPSRLSLALLSIATLLAAASAIWTPMIEPAALRLLAQVRG